MEWGGAKGVFFFFCSLLFIGCGSIGDLLSSEKHELDMRVWYYRYRERGGREVTKELSKTNGLWSDAP